jgi:hypothetical protein
VSIQQTGEGSLTDPTEVDLIVGGAVVDQKIGFAAWAVGIDNNTSQYVFLPDVNRYVPPGVSGAIYTLAGSSHVVAQFQTPPQVTVLVPTSGQVASLTFYPYPVPPSSGTVGPGAITGTPTNNLVLATLVSAAYGGAGDVYVGPGVTIPPWATKYVAGFGVTAITGAPTAVTLIMDALGPDGTWYVLGALAVTVPGPYIDSFSSLSPGNHTIIPLTQVRLRIAITGGAAPTVTTSAFLAAYQ